MTRQATAIQNKSFNSQRLQHLRGKWRFQLNNSVSSNFSTFVAHSFLLKLAFGHIFSYFPVALFVCMSFHLVRLVVAIGMIIFTDDCGWMLHFF
jgi:hypothetical protein